MQLSYTKLSYEVYTINCDLAKSTKQRQRPNLQIYVIALQPEADFRVDVKVCLNKRCKYLDTNADSIASTDLPSS